MFPAAEALFDKKTDSHAPDGRSGLLSRVAKGAVDVPMDQNTNILVWNVRGLKAKRHREAMRGAVVDHNVSIVCIEETKLHVISQRLIYEMLGTEFTSFSYLPVSDTRGGILVACRIPNASIRPSHIGEFSVTVELTVRESSWLLTSVYGPQATADKVEFLDKLRAVRSTHAGVWMLAGDFNLILDGTDKSNANINRHNMGRFRHFVDEMEVKDIHLHGRCYTWSNERREPTLVKLDRILTTID